MTVPTERSPRDVRFDVWIGRLKIGAIGAFLGAITTGVLLESHFVRRSEFDGFVASQAKLDEHEIKDKARFAIKEDVIALEADLRAHAASTSHQGTAADLTAIRVSLAQLQADMAWLKERERRRGGGP